MRNPFHEQAYHRPCQRRNAQTGSPYQHFLNHQYTFLDNEVILTFLLLHLLCDFRPFEVLPAWNPTFQQDACANETASGIHQPKAPATCLR